MKKVLAFLLIASITVFATACSTDTKESVSNNASSSAEPSASAVDDKGTDAEKGDTISGDLGNYHIEIESARLAKDYDDKPVIVIKYKYTNNGDEAESFLTAVSSSASQNGKALDSAAVNDDAVDAEKILQEVEPGATLELEEGYILADETTPVDVEVTEFLSLDDKGITASFDIT